MEEYIEQTASCSRSGAKRAGSIISIVLSAVFLLLAAVFAAVSVIHTVEGKMKFNWIPAACAAVFILLAFLLWRKKDAVSVDYDYCFFGGEISVSAVYNYNRRRHLLSLPLGSVRMCGSTESAAYKKIAFRKDISKNKWYANEDLPLYFFVYEKDGRQAAALLELDDRMLSAIRRCSQLPVGAWHDKEGKQNSYAGLS
ncbi:MAG: hypothetical protein IJA26_04875 [Clostridia bacterium]|nr:hypothetical protein [Clostridia bacterium]